MSESYIRNVIEAALLAAGRPLQPAELIELFEESARPTSQAIQAALAALAAEFADRGIEIKETAAGFRIQVRKELANEVSRLWPERPARYSRALLETLALIAYRQPITRAEIEAVRGVAVNPNIIKTVLERNWVRVVGHRDVPGRPELLGTTREFLDYFGLRSLDELPPLAQIKALDEIKMQYDLDPATLGSGTGAAAADGEALPPIAVDAGLVEAQIAEAVETDGLEVTAEVVSGAPGADGHVSVGNHVETGDQAATDDHSAAASQAAAEGVVVADGLAAAHEAEEFVASLDANLASDDEEGQEEDELSAAGPGSGELVAGPRDLGD